ncbi:hypothetical protein CBR_g18988 [Chara braunii]|uniref:Uncharacterized protein n=1 Tax=Chara braunii TaxID=69332 RepID=A0A388KX01_CHABU|nr:hypothetical protein CBR_g18988 [Chara braunii]|eukprot:GBG74579.1 hypothetical protein CBR_g18988 [Chara braunii]
MSTDAPCSALPSAGQQGDGGTPAIASTPAGAGVAGGSLKEQGNALFKAGSFLRAAVVYTQAIKEDPNNHTLYSNRSAAFLQLSKVTQALKDAEQTIRLAPTWEKGYFRKGCALEAMKKFDESLEAFQKAAEKNPKSVEVSTKIKQMARQIRDRRRAEGRDNNARNEGESKSGKKGPLEINCDDNRVTNFARKIIEGVTEICLQNGGKLDPAVHFLSCKEGSNDDLSEQIVTVKEAFESPETLSKCVGFLRQYSTEVSALAACLVVPRNCIAYPQVWNGRGVKNWRFGAKDGFFVQLEMPKNRQLWFLPAFTEKNPKSVRSAESLDVEVYAVLPPLFR